MKPPFWSPSKKTVRILSTSISSALIAGAIVTPFALGITSIWDGGGTGGTDLGTAVNWSGDALPSVATPDTAQWNGTVAGPLSLIYSDASFAGAAGNTGLNLSVTGTQTSSLNIDSGANTSSLRLNNITIDAGAGAFSLGDGTGTFNITLGGVAGQTHTWTNNSSNTAVLASDVVIGLGGGGTHTLALGGSGNWTLNNIVSGAINLTKNDNGTLTLTNANTYTGATTVNKGTFLLSGANGAITGASTYALNGGSLILDNTTAAGGNNANRIADTSAISLNGGNFIFKGADAAGTNSTETVGAISGTGNSTITLKFGGTNLATLTAASFTHAAGNASILVNGVNLGQDSAGTASESRFVITTAPTLVGATAALSTGINAAAQNTQIVPFLVGEATSTSGGLGTATGIANTFVTYNATTGLRPLNLTDEFTSNTIVAGNNTLITAPITVSAGAAINSLILSGGDLTISDGVTLTNTSGALLFTTSNAIQPSGSTGNLDFGATEGIITVNSGISGTISAVISGTAGLTKGGAGTLTLSGANTLTGSVNLNGGALNINNASALASTAAGTLTVTGGTIDNTSGVPITTTTATTLNLNGNLTFIGSNNLNFNGGTMAVGGAAGTRTLTINAGVLSVNGLTAPAGITFSKAGAGTLLLTTTANNINNLGGILDIQAGKLQVSGDTTFAGISGAGTLENGGAASKWLFDNQNVDTTFSGTIQDGPTAGVRLGLVKSGTGTLNLTGASNSPGDRFDLQNGTIRITGTYTMGYANGGNQVALIGSVANQNGILRIDGGTFNANKTGSPSLAVATAANASGFIEMTSGAINTLSELHIGNGNGAATTNPYAALTMSGGSITSGSWLVVGFNNDRAVLNQSGGTINVSTAKLTIATGGNNALGVANLSGGTLTSNGGINVGEVGTGILNVSGNAVLSTGAAGTVQFGGNAAQVAGTVNLLGGTIATNSVAKGASTATAVELFNFEGGTLKATASNTAFFNNLAQTTAYVYGAGGTIDNGGNTITIAQSLLAPTGNGVGGIASFTGGAGYVDTPIVTIVRGAGDTTGVGATAVATVSNGVVTGITITNPGVGYTAIPTFTIFGGGATTAATVTGTAPVANVTGAMTFQGAGNTTLTGTNTYGSTIVSGSGTLTLARANGTNDGQGVISGPLTVNSGATVVASSVNALGTILGQRVDVANVNGGTLNTTATGDQGFNTTFNLTGGTLTSNGGVSSAAATSYWLLAKAADGTASDAVNSLASSTTSVIAGRLHLRDDNGQSNVNFNVADGAAPTDLLVSAAITSGTLGGGASAVGIIKTGSGLMSLTGTNAYTGATSVSNGTLLLSGAGSINGSSGITINGAGAKLIQTSSAAVTPTITLTTGTLDGTGTISTVNVGAGTGGIITNGNGTAGAALTIGALTFGGAANINLLLSSSTAAPLVTTTLTTTGAGSITLTATNTIWTNGTIYNLISYSGGSILGTGFAGFNSTVTVNGLGARQSYTLGNSGTAITLSIAGDLPIWTGAASANWTSTPIGGAFNWRKQSNSSGTEFFALNDTPLFDDTATGTTSVNISNANVTPTSTTFNNSTKNYTISSTGGFGIAGGLLLKNGTGSLTINTANTYAGGTTLNAGTLNINNASAIGSGPLIISGGTINNTNGGGITLTTNNPLNWNGSFTFGGTNALNFGTGAVTLGTSPTVTTNGSAALTVGGAISGSGFGLTKAGPGTLVLNGASTFDGGFSITGGTVQAGSNTALGASTNAFSFGASSGGKLKVNGNTVTVGGLSGDSTAIIENSNATAGSLIVNLSGASLYSGLLRDGTAGTLALTKSGNGTLTLDTTTNTYSGGTTLSAGTLNINSASAIGTGPLTILGGTIDSTSGGVTLAANNAQNWNGSFTFGGSNSLNLGTGAVALNSTPVITTNGTGVLTVGGVISGAGFGFDKTGPGTLTLSGANTFTGPITVSAGILNLSGAINAAAVANTGQVTIGDTTANAILNIAGGTINATNATIPSFNIGSVVNASAEVNMTSGSVTTNNEFWVGGGNAYAAFTMSGGTLSVPSWFVVGRGGGSSVMNMSGGTLNASTVGGNFTVGTIAPNGKAVVNLSGSAVVNDTGSLLLPEQQAGNVSVLNVSGGAALNIAGASGITYNFGNAAVNNSGIVNLNGGNITTKIVQKAANGTGNYLFNFNGGTLTAGLGASTGFMTGLTAAYIYSGGAIIDTNAQFITIGQSLLAPTANGVDSIALLNGGAGYIDTPVVTLTGGTGIGATAVATVTGGVVTGFTVTSRGSGYSPDDILTATLSGGGASTVATTGTVALSTNTGGGLTKQGNGTLTLTGANTYTGPTNINGGIVNVGATEAAGIAGPLGVLGTITFGGGTLQYSASNSADYSSRFSAAPNQAVSIDTNGQFVVFNSPLNSSGGSLTLNDASGSGSLTLTATNTYTGGTTIGFGATLQLGDGSTDGTIANSSGITNNGTLIYNRAGALTSGIPITGAGSVVVTGPGSQTLTAVNDYMGTTTVQGGSTLIVSGSLSGTTGTTVATGSRLFANGTIINSVTTSGTVGGNGTITGDLISTGGIISPGTILNGTGTLSLGGSLMVDSASILSIALGGSQSGQFGRVSANGINLASDGGSGAILSLSLINGYVPVAGDLLVIGLNSGLESGIFQNTVLDSTTNYFKDGLSYPSIKVNGREFYVSYNATASKFTGGSNIALLAVPEPTSAAFLLGGLGSIIGLHRFRRRAREEAAS